MAESKNNTPLPSGRFQDLTGQTFNRLFVLGWAGRNKHGRLMWNCRCSCGNELLVSGNALSRKNTKSCGCLKNEITGNRRRTHGLSRSPEYKSWSQMISRCENENNPDYQSYGGRGISICREWRNSFEQFLTDMGNMPDSSFEIERMNNDGGYCPTNCRWATRKEQTRNKRTTRWLEHNGERRSLAEWAEIYGISARMLWARLNRGWSVGASLCGPLDHWSRRK